MATGDAQLGHNMHDMLDLWVGAAACIAVALTDDSQWSCCCVVQSVLMLDTREQAHDLCK